MLRTSLFTLKRLLPTKAVSNGPTRVQPSHTASMGFATSSSIPETNSNSSVTNQLISEKMHLHSLAYRHDYELALDKPHLDDRLEKQEIIDKLTSETSSVPTFSDYHLCLEHEVGDFDLIPEDLQLKIRNFAEKTFIPDVLDYLGTKHPIFQKYSAYQIELQGFEYDGALLRGRITNEERYDLWRLESILTLPWGSLFKIKGRRLVGSAIRISKAISKPEHANTFHQIVEGHFIPHEHQDCKDSARSLFDLYVEPSTGGIQCNCCKDVE